MLVVGAGPAGLAIAACLRERGIAFDLADRSGEPGGAYRRAYAAMHLASPVRYNALPGLAIESASEYMTVGEYGDYLVRFARHHRLEVRGAEIARLERAESGFLAHDGDGSRAYSLVVLATGMFDFPKVPEIAGLEGRSDAFHASKWQGPSALAGQRVLIVGSATSAVEIAEECAQAGLRPCVAARNGRVRAGPSRVLGRDVHDYAFLIEWLPAGLARAYCGGKTALPAGEHGFSRLRREGRIDVRADVVGFEGRYARFEGAIREEFDAVVLATGYRYLTPYLPLAVRRHWDNHALATRGGESVSWPGLFVMGHACASGLASQFLRGMAADAPRVAERIERRLRT